jgi:hypothetical protein
MDIALILLIAIAAWQVLRVQYQRTHIALLGNYLASLQLERHMETLTNGYTRAIHEKEETRQTQVLETFAQAERTMAAQVQSLADAMRKESSQAASMGTLPFCLPYIELFLPALTRDFRELLRIHAAGLRHVVDNEGGWDMKSRAYHLSAELYLLQHSCHWFCKSRTVADARLVMQHQVNHQKVLESVSDTTRAAYMRWMRGSSQAHS